MALASSASRGQKLCRTMAGVAIGAGGTGQGSQLVVLRIPPRQGGKQRVRAPVSSARSVVCQALLRALQR